MLTKHYRFTSEEIQTGKMDLYSVYRFELFIECWNSFDIWRIIEWREIIHSLSNIPFISVYLQKYIYKNVYSQKKNLYALIFIKLMEMKFIVLRIFTRIDLCITLYLDILMFENIHSNLMGQEIFTFSEYISLFYSFTYCAVI